MWYEWRPYVPVAERRRKALAQMQKLAKKGHPVSPVILAGRAIATTFWGKAWCENLERYSDFSNRLPRGRTYVRNGSVVDLQIAPGEVKAIVSGSSLYKVTLTVSDVPKTRWGSICKDCAGGIDSLVELLQGRFSKGVMERICQQRTGLFPSPAEIKLSCSCPDWASMCKHVAAVLYGIGARLDQHPELLFKLRRVDEKDLIASAGRGMPLSMKAPARSKVLKTEGLSEIFGLELGSAEHNELRVTPRTPATAPKKRRRTKSAGAKTVEAPKLKKKQSSPAKPAAKPITNVMKPVPRTKVKATKKRRKRKEG